MWEFTATVTGSGLGALLVMAWIECYIRERILHRRLADRHAVIARAPCQADVLQEASDVRNH